MRKNTSDPTVLSAKEILSQGFQTFQDDPEGALVLVADQMLCAATKTTKLDFRPTASARLVVLIGDKESLEVGLPHDSISSFRTILARLGVICHTAAQKRSLGGKLKSYLRREGIITDRMLTEHKSRPIEYVCAMIREQPGSPLYMLDADLNIRDQRGHETGLHLQVQNNPKEPFLTITCGGGVSPTGDHQL